MPYLCSVHKPCPLLWEETVPAMHMVNSLFCLCTSLSPGPMIVVFGLEMGLYVRMNRKLENGVLSNAEQPQSVVNGFCLPG